MILKGNAPVLCEATSIATTEEVMPEYFSWGWEKGFDK